MTKLAPNIQKYMTLTDCPYCHNTSATEVANNPRIVKCNICSLYRPLPRINKDGQIFLLKKFNDEIDLAERINLLERGNGERDPAADKKL